MITNSEFHVSIHYEKDADKFFEKHEKLRERYKVLT